MKKTFTILSFLMFAAMAAFAQNKTDSPPPVLAGTELREKIAADFLANMVGENYEAARKDFAKTLADVMTTEHLYQKWHEVTAKIGVYQKVEYTKEEKVSDNYSVKKRCIFSYQNMSVVLQFNEENQVIAIWYRL